MTIHVLQPLGHSLKELAWRLSRVRGQKVPDRTLRWRIEQLHIEPNAYGLYEDTDLAVSDLLISLVSQTLPIRHQIQNPIDSGARNPCPLTPMPSKTPSTGTSPKPSAPTLSSQEAVAHCLGCREKQATLCLGL